MLCQFYKRSFKLDTRKKDIKNMDSCTILKCAFFYFLVMFLLAEIKSQTITDDSQNTTRSCEAPSHCAPIRQLSSLWNCWNRRDVEVKCGCGSYRMFCCPRVNEAEVRVRPLSQSKLTTNTVSLPTSEASPDDNDAPTLTFPSCSASSHCIPIRRCPAFRDGWKRRGVGITCGYGSGPYRMVCCPRVYREEVPIRLTTRSMSTTSSTPPPKSEECGLIHEMDWSQEQDLEDSGALQATWPWMADITIRNSTGHIIPYCGGSLIDRTHVLTAASCFLGTDRYMHQFAVLAGSDDLDAAEEYPIIGIKNHEDYKVGYFYNNIAIVTLGREVNITNFSPICLPDDTLARMELSGLGTIVLGWRGLALQTGDPDDNLLKQLDNVPILTNKECNQIYSELLGERFERWVPSGITDDMMCLGMTEAGRDECGKLSGGPVMILYKKRWFVVGISSFAYTCSIPGIPGGYTRISIFKDWIKQTVQNETIQNTTTTL